MSSLETNQEYSKILEDNVKLTCKAVAVKLLASEEELPEGYDLIDEKVRHCEMIRKASYGEKFYSTIEQQSCLGGAGAIGLRDMPPKLASGEKYFELVERENDWIPVSERLPKKPEIDGDSDDYIVQTRRVAQPFIGYWDGREWTDEEVDILDEVIAWMPLPEPYKEVEDGN